MVWRTLLLVALLHGRGAEIEAAAGAHQVLGYRVRASTSASGWAWDVKWLVFRDTSGNELNRKTYNCTAMDSGHCCGNGASSWVPENAFGESNERLSWGGRKGNFRYFFLGIECSKDLPALGEVVITHKEDSTHVAESITVEEKLYSGTWRALATGTNLTNQVMTIAILGASQASNRSCKLPADTTGYITTACGSGRNETVLERDCVLTCNTTAGYNNNNITSESPLVACAVGGGTFTISNKCQPAISKVNTVKGSIAMEMSSADASMIVKDSISLAASKAMLGKALADTIDGVDAADVNIIAIIVDGKRYARRLEERRLAGKVTIEYELVTVVDKTITVADIPSAALATNIQKQSKAAGMPITVTKVVVAKPTVTIPGLPEDRLNDKVATFKATMSIKIKNANEIQIQEASTQAMANYLDRVLVTVAAAVKLRASKATVGFTMTIPDAQAKPTWTKLKYLNDNGEAFHKMMRTHLLEVGVPEKSVSSMGFGSFSAEWICTAQDSQQCAQVSEESKGAATVSFSGDFYLQATWAADPAGTLMEKAARAALAKQLKVDISAVTTAAKVKNGKLSVSFTVTVPTDAAKDVAMVLTGMKRSTDDLTAELKKQLLILDFPEANLGTVKISSFFAKKVCAVGDKACYDSAMVNEGTGSRKPSLLRITAAVIASVFM